MDKHQIQLKIKPYQLYTHNLASLRSFLQVKKMLQQQTHVHSHLPQLGCMELHNRPKVLILSMECLIALTSDQILPKGSVEQGVPLRLVIRVYDVDNSSCIPLSGAKVDIWHANSQGVYSGVKDMGTTEENFLRGYQVTDTNGTVHFTTIYPGWYEGRAIHIHDKVRTFNGSEKTLEWTAQLYFNNSINEQVHEQSPYNNHGTPQTTNEEDMIYSGTSTDGLI